VIASSSTFPSRTVGWLITTRPCPALKVRAASTSLPTLFPSPVASRPPPSSSHQEPSMKWLRPVDHVRYVDPQRRYTAVLGPSWNVLFRALPHDDRAGTHDSADGRCGSYASTRRGQAARSVDIVEKSLGRPLQCGIFGWAWPEPEFYRTATCASAAQP
jgi:hypothetical protein